MSLWDQVDQLNQQILIINSKLAILQEQQEDCFDKILSLLQYKDQLCDQIDKLQEQLLNQSQNIIIQDNGMYMYHKGKKLSNCCLFLSLLQQSEKSTITDLYGNKITKYIRQCIDDVEEYGHIFGQYFDTDRDKCSAWLTRLVSGLLRDFDVEVQFITQGEYFIKTNNDIQINIYQNKDKTHFQSFELIKN